MTDIDFIPGCGNTTYYEMNCLLINLVSELAKKVGKQWDITVENHELIITKEEINNG